MTTFWEKLKPEDQVKLINYQWEVHGQKLDIMVRPAIHKLNYPSLEEIEREMKKPPRGVKKVK